MKYVNISDGNIYFSIFKQEAPSFSAEAMTSISTMGDLYVYEYFWYIRIWGNNIVHMLPKIVPDGLVIKEVSFQTITNGMYKKLVVPKKNAGLTFLWILGH